MDRTVIAQMAQAAKNNGFDLFELAFFNNPNSLVYALREKGHTALVKPDGKEVAKVIRRLVVMKDKAAMRSVLSLFKYDAANGNFSTNADLWNEIGVRPGDFVAVIDKMK